MPAGVRKPKQKASAEGTVGNIATDIIAKLRNITFHDFPTLKEAVARELKAYNMHGKMNLPSCGKEYFLQPVSRFFFMR